MRIPREFELQGRTIRIVLSDDLESEDCYGKWESARERITLDATAPKDIRVHSLWHEFLHAALEACGREDLSNDERFVDTLAGYVHQMLKSSRF